MTEKNGIDKIYKIMELTREVKKADIVEVQEMINGQVNYVHPFKRSEMAEVRAIGEHNQRMLDSFIELKTVVDDWEETDG